MSVASATDRSPHTVHCAVCGAATRCGKPVCSDHVLRMPYACGVARRVEDREAEVRGRSPDVRGPLATDVLEALVQFRGVATMSFVRKQIQGGDKSDAMRVAVRRVVMALRRKGMLRTVCTKRGDLVLFLRGPERLVRIAKAMSRAC